MSSKQLVTVAVLGFGVIGAFSSSASAIIWNAAAEFSSAANPNGVWSYGTRSTATGTALSLLSDGFDLSPTLPLVGWFDGANNELGTPAIYVNTSSIPAVNGTVTVPGNSLAMHPGPVGFGPGGMSEFVVVRWTAPIGGIASVSGSFLAFDSGATDVHLVLNGTTVYTAIRGGGSNAAFSEGGLAVNPGDTLDFVVGNAGSFFNDTTGLDATIVIPAPGAVALMGMGGLVAMRRRRA